MKVAVIGATGVYGRSLVPVLRAAGHDVLALVRSPEKARTLFDGQAEILALDLLAPDAAQRLPALLSGVAAVMHIATAIPADPRSTSDWEANARLRTEGTRALLDASLTVRAGCYVQQSIVMAYPDCGDEWIDESVPLKAPDDPATPSPVIVMEQMVRAVPRDRMRTVILRGGIFVGPGTFQERTIARLRAGTETIPCDGRNFISHIHVADMAAATVAALQHAPSGSIFNVVDEPIRQGEYLERLAAVVGAPRPPYRADMPGPPSYRCSNRAAREILHWQPTHGIFPHE